VGTSAGSIMAAIITTHILTYETAEPSQLWPCILIQAIDMVQPPGMAMPPDIDWQNSIVVATFAMKKSALVPRKTRSRVSRMRLSKLENWPTRIMAFPPRVPTRGRSLSRAFNNVDCIRAVYLLRQAMRNPDMGFRCRFRDSFSSSEHTDPNPLSRCHNNPVEG